MSRVIHQLVHTLSYGDAISGEVLALQRCFHEEGWESEVFAINVHPKLSGRARPYTELSDSFAGEVLLHYSLGSPLNLLFQKLSNARRGLIYHNLTPPHWFEGVNPRIVKDIENGREELPALCALSDYLLADSRFNAGELTELGFQAQVLELPIDPARWSEDSNPGIASMLQSDPSLHLLHVGRLAPNKCIEDVLKVFYFLHHYVNPNSKLWLAGIDIDTELYSFSLKRMVHEFDLGDAVRFVGCLADSELRAMYEQCSVYMCMSEHEGFCLPLIEAMHFGLPVIAYASSAVPDTLGGAGVLIHEKRHAEIAELVQEIYMNTSLRNRLVKLGRERIASLSYDSFKCRVRELLYQDSSSVRHAV